MHLDAECQSNLSEEEIFSYSGPVISVPFHNIVTKMFRTTEQTALLQPFYTSFVKISLTRKIHNFKVHIC